MGPVSNRRQFDRAKQFLEDIQKNQQKLLSGGKAASDGNGFFVDLTLVDNPDDKSMVAVEEPFAPILPLFKFSDVDEVIKRANASDLGLGGSVWGADIAECERIADLLETGTVSTCRS